MRLTDALTAEHAVLRRLLDYVDREAASWPLEALPAAGGTVAAALSSHATVEDDLLFAALAQVNELAGAHFAKEEAVLFQLAAHVLTDSDLERLGRAWSDRRNSSVPHLTQEAS